MLSGDTREKVAETARRVIDDSWHYSWHWKTHEPSWMGYTLDGWRQMLRDGEHMLDRYNQRVSDLRILLPRIARVIQEIAKEPTC